MGTESFSVARYWEPTEAASAAKATKALADSIDAKLLGSFTTTTARDSAAAPLISAGKKGMRAFVESGPGGFADWCGWDGAEWLWDHPVPLAYNSATISGTSVNYNTWTGHNPSVYSFTPSRSGFVTIGLYISAQIGVAGIGAGYLRPRYSSGTLLPGAPQFTAINDNPAGYRYDSDQVVPQKIWAKKNVAVTLAFDLLSFSVGGGAYWVLNNAQWKIVQD